MTTLSAEVIAKIRALRKMQKLSCQTLADRMTAAGYPVSRGVLSNTETGRVAEVSVDFADAAARALGTNLTSLLAQPVACPTCHGRPLTGFTCNTCGGGS